MRFLSWLRDALEARLGRAVSATPEPSEGASENDRRSIRDVTLEQLGIAHWSCHSHL